MTRRIRLLCVLLAVVGGGFAVITSTQTWFAVTLAENPDAVLEVTGAAALPVLAPIGLAVLALAAALSIAGRFLAYLVGALTVVLGGVLVALVWPIAAEHPVSALASSVTEATGIAGDAAIAEMIGAVQASGWPAVAVVSAILIVVCGFAILATTHLWRAVGRRYRTSGEAVRRSHAAQPTAESGAPSGSASTDAPIDAFDAWDGLSRGDDPT